MLDDDGAFSELLSGCADDDRTSSPLLVWDEDEDDTGALLEGPAEEVETVLTAALEEEPASDVEEDERVLTAALEEESARNIEDDCAWDEEESAVIDDDDPNPEDADAAELPVCWPLDDDDEDGPASRDVSGPGGRRSSHADSAMAKVGTRKRW